MTFDDQTHTGCEDHAITRRSLLRRGAGRAVPLPVEALEGLAGVDTSHGMTRRQILERGVGLWVACAALGSMGTKELIEAAQADAAASPAGRILVSLYLDGGNDGLNTLVPLTDPRYAPLRGGLAIAPETTIALPDSADFGWHPALGGLSGLYNQGLVSVLPAVDYPEPDGSHFSSSAYWRRGIVGPTRTTSGWLGRTLEELGAKRNPLQGISVDWSPDPVLASHRAPTATVHDPGSVGFWMPGVWERNFTEAYRQAARGGRPSAGLAAARQAYNNAFHVQDKLAPLAKQKGRAGYPDTDLGKKLSGLARILGAGFGTRVASLSIGGFDTHDDQPDDHRRLLGDLGSSLAAWQADLQARGISDRVMTLVWSEFGRRPQVNDGLGTDHGAGGLLLLVGDHANGGIRSEFPGLGSLDPNKNLRVTTDFRHVYATLLESWLGVEAARVLPGIGPERLPILR
ncbi:DUF1501 domain-containing protein [Miltoncostaea oceani]|uniref:DUF1501 domain-containing protein n=1 Tax=Miltoncostaea oceani TaxID=2843216 RepID=UPI001C3E2197|nr:DUF1501 domain-containing protein [Miltoncostaea oceani]